jgi:hypothetical protein
MQAGLHAALDVIDAVTMRITAAGLLRTQLSAARLGILDIDWRTDLLARSAEPMDDLDDHHRQILDRAAAEIANIPNQAWEPDMGVGWRESLEAWYDASKRCVQDTLDAQVQLRRATGLASARDLDDAATMDLDLVIASYRAGLTSAGLVSDWHQWLTTKVHGWPRGPRRDTQLAALADPQWRQSLQQLPKYWA